MLKHLVRSHRRQLETFDDFYRHGTKLIKSHSSPSSPTYTFHDVFCDFTSVTSDIVSKEEDPCDIDRQNDASKSRCVLGTDRADTQRPRDVRSHGHVIIHHVPSLVKQKSIDENAMYSVESHPKQIGCLKRSLTSPVSTGIREKEIQRQSNDDCPLTRSATDTNEVLQEKRSFFARHFRSLKRKSGKRKDPYGRSFSTPLLSKLSSFFHRRSNPSSDRPTCGVHNLVTRFRPRIDHSWQHPCQTSTESNKEQLPSRVDDYVHLPRSTKPVILKRVHTYHNSFDLRPLEQCLEY